MDAAIVAVIGTLLGASSSSIIQMFRSRSDHTHELKRDQRAKQYDFYLTQYKERRDACGTLLITARRTVIWEHTGYSSTDLASGTDEFVNAMRVLLTDKNANEVIQRYSEVPSLTSVKDIDGPLSRAGMEKVEQELEQQWRDGVNRLQDAVNAYLHTLEHALFSDDMKASGI